MHKLLFILSTILLAPLNGYAAEKFVLGSDMGTSPVLEAPDSSIIPKVNIASAKGWPEGKAPKPAPGFAVTAFASGLDHPRWVYVLPNGDVLVAESNKPAKLNNSIKGFFAKQIQKKAGAGTESANRIRLLRDADGDGKAEMKRVLISGLHSPFGMALVGNNLYVANTDSIMRFPYIAGDTLIASRGEKLADLPGGELNHHWTKSLVASKDGKYLYAGVGSNSNIGENGMDNEEGRAAIHEISIATGETHVFASGLRNPVGMDWEPKTNVLWTAVNERDELGDNLVPDYMTSVKDGGFYGWPYSYFGQHVDERVKPQQPDLVAKAIKPDYALGSHTASLGLEFYDGKSFPAKYHGGVFIGQHGSWNRSKPAGYKVIFIPFKNGKPNGKPEDVLTGFREGKTAYGRPVGVAVDKKGALLVADDVGNIIWRVTPVAR